MLFVKRITHVEGVSLWEQCLTVYSTKLLIWSQAVLRPASLSTCAPSRLLSRPRTGCAFRRRVCRNSWSTRSAVSSPRFLACSSKIASSIVPLASSRMTLVRFFWPAQPEQVHAIHPRNGSFRCNQISLQKAVTRSEGQKCTDNQALPVWTMRNCQVRWIGLRFGDSAHPAAVFCQRPALPG